MPVLERKKDGDYYIRARLHSNGCVVTWQVRRSGLIYLSRHGVYAGRTFPTQLLQNMIAANQVFTGGSGIHVGNVDVQNKLSIPAAVPLKNTFFKSNSFSRANSPRKSKGNTRPDTIIRSATSLVFRKYKKRWELVIVFPKIFADNSKRHLFMSGYCLTVDGTTNTLKTKQFLPNCGEAFLPVIPQMADYKIQLSGPSSSYENVVSLIEALKNVMCEVKGLNPAGTVFKTHDEISSWKEGTRLNKNVPMFPGRSYFVIFHTSHIPKMVPPTVQIKNLGNTGMWEAWEIQLPTERGTDVVNWCANLGHILHR